MAIPFSQGFQNIYRQTLFIRVVGAVVVGGDLGAACSAQIMQILPAGVWSPGTASTYGVMPRALANIKCPN